MMSDIEDVASFTQRARQWLAANMPPLPKGHEIGGSGRFHSDEEELARIARRRELQRLLFDGGLAGFCVPTAVWRPGADHGPPGALQRRDRRLRLPGRHPVPTFTPCMAVILDFGTEEQKKRHIPPMLQGEEFWMQFLSEPSGGSDVAGAQTTAIRDGEEWVMNGSKIWTTGAWWADGACAWPGPTGTYPSTAVCPSLWSRSTSRARGPPHRDAERVQGVLPGVHHRLIPDADRIGRSTTAGRSARVDAPRAQLQRGSPSSRPARGSPSGGSHPLRRPGPAGEGTTRRARVTSSARPHTFELAHRPGPRRISEAIPTGRITDQAAADHPG